MINHVVYFGLKKPWHLSAYQKSTSSLTSFWDIVKTLQTCYLGNFRDAWPSLSKIIVSTYRKLSCASAHKNQLHLSFFLEYCREIVNLLFCVTWPHTPKMIVIWRKLRCLSAD